MTRPRYTNLVQNLPTSVPFVGPEAIERSSGHAFRARLGANESGFGPSPAVLRAIQDTAASTWMYGDPETFDLKHDLAAHHGLEPENFVVGEGIDGLLGYVVRLLIEPGDAVVTSDGAYPTFAYHAGGFGAAIHAVPYASDREDPTALLSAAHATEAKLIYFANPDNPMGTWHDAKTIEAMLRDLPEGCTLLLDEAYADTAPPDAIPPVSLIHPRLIRFRTFSKAYGLAGLRVGYGISAPELVSSFNKVRNHFGVGRLAQAAARAALRDQTYLRDVVQRIEAARTQIATIGRENGLAAIPSATNFVTLDCGKDGAFARELVQSLAAERIFVRMPFQAPQDRCIRVSCAKRAELDLFSEALPRAIERVHGERG